MHYTLDLKSKVNKQHEKLKVLVYYFILAKLNGSSAIGIMIKRKDCTLCVIRSY